MAAMVVARGSRTEDLAGAEKVVVRASRRVVAVVAGLAGVRGSRTEEEAAAASPGCIQPQSHPAATINEHVRDCPAIENACSWSARRRRRSKDCRIRRGKVRDAARLRARRVGRRRRRRRWMGRERRADGRARRRRRRRRGVVAAAAEAVAAEGDDLLARQVRGYYSTGVAIGCVKARGLAGRRVGVVRPGCRRGGEQGQDKRVSIEAVN